MKKTTQNTIHSNSLYEIELKSLLTEEQYKVLCVELPKKMKLLIQETLNTRKFKTPAGDDIRLRYSDKRFELVHKNGHVTDTTRKELTIKLSSKQEIDNFASLFSSLNFVEDPSWITHRMDFEYFYKEYTYFVSLQHTEKFAYILEVEFSANNKDEINIHEANIKKIILELGLEPIEPDDFSERIKKYIQENKN